MSAAIRKELVTMYRFHPTSRKHPPIRLEKSRRKSDPPNCYAPIAALLKPETRKLWNDVDLNKCLISQEYVDTCLEVDYTLEEALNGFHATKPILKNTVFIRHRHTKLLDDETYGVYVILPGENGVFLHELYQVSIRKNLSLVTQKPGSLSIPVQTKTHLLFSDYRFEAKREGRLQCFSHILSYRLRETGVIYTIQMVANAKPV